MILRCTLRLKILLALAGLLALFGGTAAFLIKDRASAKLRQEVEKRGISIAKHLAQSNIDLILARDRLALRIAAAHQKQAEEDIVYIFFLGRNRNNVLAHSFGETFPLPLLKANLLPTGAECATRELTTEYGPVFDVSVPVAEGGLGEVHLGISAQTVEQAVDKMAREVLTLTLLVMGAGILLAIPLSAAIVHPVRQLTAATQAVAEGNFETHVPATRGDEIGQLARAFNHMLAQLQKAREDLLTGNRELESEVNRRLHAEGRLARQLNFMGTLLDEIPSPVFFKDDECRIIGCNHAFEEFLGVDKEEILGRTSYDLLPEEEGRKHSDTDREVIRSAGTRSYAGQLTRADGQVREVVFHKAAFKGEDGLVAGLVGIVIDVTAEREIERLRREFVSTAAHEFQTPLAAILGYCELLLEGPQSEEDRKEFLEIIQGKAEFISRLVDQLLDVGRIEAGQGIPIAPKPCQPDRIIQQALRTYHQIAPGHRFELALPEVCPPVRADEDRFLQVMDNLLSNAVKYSPKGGVIKVVGEVAEGWFRVSVEDRGPGLSRDQVERVFDKFYRVETKDSSPSGTGLGLYITRSIVEAHGGVIQAESTPGEGTRMSFSLPLAA